MWERGEGWQRIKVTAAECGRITAQFLAEEKAAMPPMWYQSEYECVFGATEYHVFSQESIDLMCSYDPEPWFDAQLRPVVPSQGDEHVVVPEYARGG
jgi:hypothetical protein